MVKYGGFLDVLFVEFIIKKFADKKKRGQI